MRRDFVTVPSHGSIIACVSWARVFTKDLIDGPRLQAGRVAALAITANRNATVGACLAPEQERTLRSAPDTTRAVPDCLGASETRVGAGVEVPAAHASSTTRWCSTDFRGRAR